MLMRVCLSCRGDGFWRARREDIHPLSNIAHARPIRNPVTKSGYGELYDYAASIWGYEFDCARCKGRGEIQWNRGKSLTP